MVARRARDRAITASNVSTGPRKIFERQFAATVITAARRRDVAMSLSRPGEVAAGTAIGTRSAILILAMAIAGWRRRWPCRVCVLAKRECSEDDCLDAAEVPFGKRRPHSPASAPAVNRSHRYKPLTYKISPYQTLSLLVVQKFGRSVANRMIYSLKGSMHISGGCGTAWERTPELGFPRW